MFSSYPIPGVASNGFSLVTGAFLQSAGLPFAEVLPAEEIAAALAKETYATIPAALSVREVYVHVGIPGFRVRGLVVVTTLTDAGHYPQAEIARPFRARWHVELDLRSAKVHLHLDDLRCLSPEMVRREILVHWLAYNLVRKVMAQAALTQERLPRQLSFAAALAVVAGNWLQASLARQDLLRALARAQWRLIAWQRVGDRPDRVEPRAIKRRPKSHRLLTKPRQQARADLLHSRGVNR